MTNTSSSSASFTNTDSLSDSDETWISRFHNRSENSGLIMIHDSFLQDKFNLVGLMRYISNLSRSFDVIKNKMPSRNKKEEALLYYLVHQRYILTNAGMEKMLERVIQHFYGDCRRMGCEDIPLIPLGLSNNPKISSVKLYCYNCNNVFDPDNSLSGLDGCSFGSSFAHLLILTHKENFPKKKYGNYIPRIFGFRIYEEKENQ